MSRKRRLLSKLRRRPLRRLRLLRLKKRRAKRNESAI